MRKKIIHQIYGVYGPYPFLKSQKGEKTILPSSLTTRKTRLFPLYFSLVFLLSLFVCGSSSILSPSGMHIVTSFFHMLIIHLSNQKSFVLRLSRDWSLDSYNYFTCFNLDIVHSPACCCIKSRIMNKKFCARSVGNTLIHENCFLTSSIFTIYKNVLFTLTYFNISS